MALPVARSEHDADPSAATEVERIAGEQEASHPGVPKETLEQEGACLEQGFEWRPLGRRGEESLKH